MSLESINNSLNVNFIFYLKTFVDQQSYLYLNIHYFNIAESYWTSMADEDGASQYRYLMCAVLIIHVLAMEENQP